MTKEHMEAMRAGRERAKVQRDANAVARVRTYKAWLKREAVAWASGDRVEWATVLRSIPRVIPSSYDYQVARGDA